MKENLNVYLDVWIATINNNDNSAITALESSGEKCCWDTDI